MTPFLRISFSLLIIIAAVSVSAEDGYCLWLRYDKISDQKVLERYNQEIAGWIIQGKTPLLKAAGSELQTALNGLLDREILVWY